MWKWTWDQNYGMCEKKLRRYTVVTIHARFLRSCLCTFMYASPITAASESWLSHKRVVGLGNGKSQVQDRAMSLVERIIKEKKRKKKKKKEE